ncbi:hypothetical protein FOVSG1_002079 [Fusarium oxysporum f. sp. vasinfectum]
MEYRGNRPRRKVTTCGECHRRKQKCNREKPCNFCLRRGVPTRCHYEEDSESRTASTNGGEFMPTTVSTLQSTTTPEFRLLSQTGYAQSSSTNTIVSNSEPSDAIQSGSPASRHDILDILDSLAGNDYWKLTTQLPPPRVVEGLIECFFSEVNWHFQILDYSFFIDLYQVWTRANLNRNTANVQNPSLELLFFPALLFQVLAIAVMFLSQDAIAKTALGLWDCHTTRVLSERYSRIGVSLSAFFEQCMPEMIMVQHDLARCLWLKTENRGLLAWQVLGKAIRQAQVLGLHQCPQPAEKRMNDANPLEQVWLQEHRQRLWVTLFSWDSHMAILLDRPRTINISDCTAETPIGCDIPVDRLNALPTSISASARPSLFVNRLFTYSLARKIHEILTLSANTRIVSDYNIVRRLHTEIIDLCKNHHPALRANNPDTSWDQQYPVIKKQRQFAKIMANSVILSLHRDHIKVHEESRDEAMKAALACLDAQHALMSLLPPNQQRMYGLSCHCIDACIFVAYVAKIQGVVDSSLISRVQTAIRETVTRLELLDDESPFAKNMTQVLMRTLSSLRESAGHRPTTNSSEAQSPSLTEEFLPQVATDLNMDLALQDGRFRPESFEHLGDVSTSIPGADFAFHEDEAFFINPEELEFQRRFE